MSSDDCVFFHGNITMFTLLSDLFRRCEDDTKQTNQVTIGHYAEGVTNPIFDTEDETSCKQSDVVCLPKDDKIKERPRRRAQNIYEDRPNNQHIPESHDNQHYQTPLGNDSIYEECKTDACQNVPPEQINEQQDDHQNEEHIYDEVPDRFAWSGVPAHQLGFNHVSMNHELNVSKQHDVIHLRQTKTNGSFEGSGRRGFKHQTSFGNFK